MSERWGLFVCLMNVIYFLVRQLSSASEIGGFGRAEVGLKEYSTSARASSDLNWALIKIKIDKS